MKTEDLTALCFVAYFIVWGILAVGSWLKIRSCPTPQEKKKWSDRLCVVVGIFVTASMCFFLVLWRQYIGIPIFVAAGVAITFLNLRGTLYCGSCGKRSSSQNWFSSSFHCPHCGHKLK
jgi:predicted RNA-binding Zn-ribbon protein involved in translation (DUF1610 family)